MFIIPCKFTLMSPIKQCAESIKIHFPNEKIVIVDSCSENLNYSKELDVYDLITNNSNYEIGAYKKAYDKYPNEEWYYNIQDSLMFKNSIPKKFYDKELITVQWFNGFWDSSLQLEWASKNIKIPSKFIGCFGTMFFTSNNNMAKVISNLEGMTLPTQKIESCAMERIIGIILSNLGLDVSNSLQGMHISQSYKYNSEIVEKIFCGRQ